MTVPRPSFFSSASRDRAQQARVLLVMSLVFAVGVTLYFSVLPTWLNTIAVSDSSRIYLVGMTAPVEGPQPEMFAVSSTDGLHWSTPMIRGIRPRGAAALDGWLYVLLALDADRSQLNAYGEGTWNGQDDWKVIDLPTQWTAFGLGRSDDRLWVFGPKRPPESDPKPDRSAPASSITLCSAWRNDSAWVDGPTLDLPEGVPAFFSVEADSSGSFLYWQMLPAPRRPLTPHLYRARLDLDSFGPIETFDFPEPLACVVTSEGDHSLVVAQSMGLTGRPSGSVRRFVIDHGVMTPSDDVVIDRFRSHSLSEQDFTATRFQDKTRLLVVGQSHGLFLSGMYSFELQGSHAVDGALAMTPSPAQSAVTVFWLAGVLASLSLFAAALTGYLRKSIPIRLTFADPSLPAATLLERAIATSLDFAFISMVPVVLTQFLDRPPSESLFATVVAWFAYTTLMESSTGRTLGKRIVGLQVLTLDRRPPSPFVCFLRNLLKPVELLTFGPALILGSAGSQRLADLLTSTVVVFNPIIPKLAPDRPDSEGF